MRCDRCGREMEYQEAGINDRVLCHPDDPSLSDCYALESFGTSIDLSDALGLSVTFVAHTGR